MFNGSLSGYDDIDYVGAPCFEGYNGASSLNYIGLQNGGFSLRSVRKSLEACNRAKEIAGIKQLYKARYLGKRDVLAILLNKMGIKTKHQHPYHWEDMFFSFAAPILVSDFRIATYEQAYRFAFDCLPEQLFELNEKELPFGCHAFHKGYKWDFWVRYIPELREQYDEMVHSIR